MAAFSAIVVLDLLRKWKWWAQLYRYDGMATQNFFFLSFWHMRWNFRSADRGTRCCCNIRAVCVTFTIVCVLIQNKFLLKLYNIRVACYKPDQIHDAVGEIWIWRPSSLVRVLYVSYLNTYIQYGLSKTRGRPTPWDLTAGHTWIQKKTKMKNYKNQVRITWIRNSREITNRNNTKCWIGLTWWYRC